MARFLNLQDLQADGRPSRFNLKARDNTVEVLHGNQTGSRHSRRQSDKAASGDNRALDWGVLESDIALFPHSPLALADVLSTQGGFLDLIPATISEDKNDTQDPANSAVASSDRNATPSDSQPDTLDQTIDLRFTAHRHPRNPRDRFNLLTRHNAADLLKQCKKILVENALVKNKGERQLYLAAGFVSWPDASNSQERKRAPLLLYPALLVRVPNEARYEVRLAGDTPEYNQALMLHTEQRFAVKLPEFNHEAPLSDFLAQVAQSVQGSTTLALEFDIALGSASLLHTEAIESTAIELPDVPAHFNVGLAMSITGNKSLHQLNAVLQLIPNYAESVSSNDQAAVAAAHTESVAGLRKYAARLAAEGLDHVEFRQLSTLPAMISKWTLAVDSGLQSSTLSSVLNVPELSSRELIRLASIIELIDKAPASIEQFAHPDLCFSNTPLLMRRAQHQARLIEDELEALQDYFLLDKVPAKSQLLGLIAELGSNTEHEHDYVDADYFNARRQFMEFSIEKPTNLTTEHRRLLSQLAKVMRFRELFVNNTEYRAALGPAYKGLRTDWALLEQMSEYARELSDVLESESVAAQILSNWHAFRAAYSVELDTLQAAAEACRRLLGTVGTRWQTQSVSALCTHAILIRSRLLEWQGIYGHVENHADKTPAIVLSSFSGKSREDVVVETQVDETRTRIDQQLQAGEIKREQIIDTLQWLLAASNAASDKELDIDAIVAHLQIA